jgi:hypothetical protein
MLPKLGVFSIYMKSADISFWELINAITNLSPLEKLGAFRL